MPAFHDPIRYLKGVGPEMARRLERLGIVTVRDLLYHLPTGYRDRRSVTPIARVTPGVEVTVEAVVSSVEPRRRRGGRSDLVASLRDSTGFLRAVWFNQSYVADKLKVGERYLFSGTAQVFRGPELHNPEFEPAEGGDKLHVARLAPRYPLTEGVSERWIRTRIRDALDALPPVPDLVPEASREELKVPSLDRALRAVHFPETPEEAEPARRRLALEELLRLQIALQYARRRHRDRMAAPSLAAGAEAMRAFVRSLPFKPTGAQIRALASIAPDLDAVKPMRRLLLGDVGSGKTVVALAAAVRAAAAGRQTAFLAPTSLLAEQHAATAARLLASHDVRHALLTSATPEKERARILASVASGETSLLLGTHALLERDLEYRALGLVVVDEQHRFGVRQRVALAQGDADGGTGTAPHLLVLTATPIPRSLAMTLYGDLDVSPLDEKPPGRAPIDTKIVSGAARDVLPRILRDELDRGGSAFVVYPVVDASEKSDLKAATEMAAALGKSPLLQDAGVTLVHGRLKADERRAAIARFRAGEAKVLVATTVVEVGLDIPDATLVVIEHPERFGLAQLHQLRGRVGRGDRPGRCILLAGAGIGEGARRRLDVFQRIGDGFKLAEEDLRLRGPGELLGTSQHGFPELRAANPLLDSDLVEAARRIGRAMLEERAESEGSAGLRAWIEAHFAGAERYLGSG
ncbi:MAG TPA: ATP-dependent DNA helicase RecG [Candidatus Eisenbacteria bacterium]|nr:ATP-dependent DNA helicase RecG [Candidatus Eisenbacteria bacterium]